tara:strand:- start:714 stop:1103 length:390 start_codon:yes stop_codon:yes gene_type:complete
MKSVFSKIINKEIPCHLVAEDLDNIAFMDINPIAIGHVLIVPKKEIDSIFDLDNNTYHSLWDFAKKVSFALKKTIPCNRIGVSVIGLEVPHAHIHLVPINKITDMDFQKKTFSSINLEELAQKISRQMI